MQETFDDQTLIHKIVTEAGLTNSDILTDMERLRGRRLLSEAEHTLFALGREISQLAAIQPAPTALQWELNNLIASHEELEARISKLQVATAPHKRLPPEILVEIFLFCVGVDVAILPPDASRSPWSLSRVCSQWRNVIFNEPLFWNRISFDLSAHGLLGLKAAQHAIGSKRILSITMECSEEQELSDEALKVLVMPRLPNLRQLDLSLPYGTLHRLFESPPVTFSSIESLQLNVIKTSPNISEHVPELRDYRVLTMARSLRKLHLSSFEPKIMYILLYIQIPWRQITHLELSTVQALSFGVIHAVLQQCIHLEILSAEIGCSHNCSIGSDGDCRLPHLRRLTLTIQDNHIFKCLFIPSLTELHVSGDFPFPSPELSIMIQRSRCDLLVFDYNGDFEPIWYDVNVLDDFLKLIPSLVSFSTFFLILREQTLSAIATGELLPRLHTMQIRIESPIDFVDLIEARLYGDVDDYSGIAVFQEARGYFVRMLHTYSLEMGPAVERLRALNEIYNTSFTLMED